MPGVSRIHMPGKWFAVLLAGVVLASALGVDAAGDATRGAADFRAGRIRQLHQGAM